MSELTDITASDLVQTVTKAIADLGKRPGPREIGKIVDAGERALMEWQRIGADLRLRFEAAKQDAEQDPQRRLEHANRVEHFAQFYARHGTRWAWTIHGEKLTGDEVARRLRAGTLDFATAYAKHTQGEEQPRRPGTARW